MVRAIDTHVHVYFAPDTADQVSAERPPSDDAVQKLLDDSRLHHIGVVVIASEDFEDARAQNDALLAFTATDPRLFPIASVHPRHGEQGLDEIRRVAEAGAKMIKIHQNTQDFDLEDPGVADVIAAATDAGLPVLLEGTMVMDPNTVGKVLMLAISHPESRLVMAHMGGIDFRQMKTFAMLEEYPWWPRNIWYDISWTVSAVADSPLREEFVWMVRQLGVDRVMFGSDFPMATPESALSALETLGLDADELDAVSYGTAAELLDL